MLISQATFGSLFFGLATKVAAIPVQEIDITPSGLNVTYVHCGTGTTLTNLDDLNCPKLHPFVNKVFHHEIQDDGTWKTTISNRSIEEAEHDSKISARHTNGELADLASRDVPCLTYVETWFTTDNWGYWYNSWKQIGQCFYCDSCSYAAQYSASVTQTWTVGLGANMDDAIQATFGYSWGYSQGFSNTFTCNWNPGDTYGCHSVWFQPLMTYHNGWPNWQVHAYNSGACGFTTTNHQSTYANVNQFPDHNGDINSGNWGCGKRVPGFGSSTVSVWKLWWIFVAEFKLRGRND